MRYAVIDVHVIRVCSGHWLSHIDTCMHGTAAVTSLLPTYNTYLPGLPNPILNQGYFMTTQKREVLRVAPRRSVLSSQPMHSVIESKQVPCYRSKLPFRARYSSKLPSRARCRSKLPSLPGAGPSYCDCLHDRNRSQLLFHACAGS